MKIIKAGKIENKKVFKNPYQGSCNKCKCVFVYSDNDLILRVKYSDSVRVLKCPTCFTSITIKDKMPNGLELKK